MEEDKIRHTGVSTHMPPLDEIGDINKEGEKKYRWLKVSEFNILAHARNYDLKAANPYINPLTVEFWHITRGWVKWEEGDTFDWMFWYRVDTGWDTMVSSTIGGGE